MDSQKIDLYLMTSGKYFPSEQMGVIRSHLEKLDDSKFINLQSQSMKEPTTVLIISILAGHLGIDRFMLGETGLGIAKLLTCGGLGIWTIVDWFIIMNKTRDINMQKFMTATSY
jgi:TM2 domain-containing membrane protein YozV